jgi:dATP pyrophosphohydrolase
MPNKPATPLTTYKHPESVLVVIHSADGQVLLIRRVDSGTWQSVTGSKEGAQESWWDTACREVHEETGIDAMATGHVLRDWGLENTYDIYPKYLHRYAPGVTRNTERVFGLTLPRAVPVTLHPQEHTEWRWVPYPDAADQVFSPSNAEAILWLPKLGLISP